MYEGKKMQYKLNYNDLSETTDEYMADVYDTDFSRRVSIKENAQVKCYVLDEAGKITITLKDRNIELSHEEARDIMMGLLVESHDVGINVEIVDV